MFSQNPGRTFAQVLWNAVRLAAKGYDGRNPPPTDPILNPVLSTAAAASGTVASLRYALLSPFTPVANVLTYVVRQTMRSRRLVLRL